MNDFFDFHDTPFDSCEVLNFGMASWTSMESLLNYSLRGVHLKPRIIVIYHGINDAVAGSIPPGATARPDYSHWRTPWIAVPRPVWDLLPESLDRFRLVGLARYGLSKLFLSELDPNQLFRCGLRYSYESGQGETPFNTFGSNLSAIVSVALNCSTTVFVVSQVHVSELTEEVFDSGDLADRVAAINSEAEEVAHDFESTGRVFFIDAALDLPIRREMMRDNCHFTPEGYAVLGSFIAGEMLAVLDSLQWDLSEPLDFR
jgi:lysophospholipase L1-like esterase